MLNFTLWSCFGCDVPARIRIILASDNIILDVELYLIFHCYVICFIFLQQDTFIARLLFLHNRFIEWGFLFKYIQVRIFEVEYIPWIHWPFLCGVCLYTSTCLLSYWEKYAWHRNHYIDDGLVQEIRSSSALAMELRLSCTNPYIYIYIYIYISIVTSSATRYPLRRDIEIVLFILL